MKKFLLLSILFFLPVKVKAALPIGTLVSISTDTRFQNRCNYYLQAAAVNVMAEAQNTVNHSIRFQFAKGIMTGGGPALTQLAIDVLTNTTIAAEANNLTVPDFAIPDGDIQFAVNSLFNALAGAGN